MPSLGPLVDRAEKAALAPDQAHGRTPTAEAEAEFNAYVYTEGRAKSGSFIRRRPRAVRPASPSG
jgi:hypothetical protein